MPSFKSEWKRLISSDKRKNAENTSSVVAPDMARQQLDQVRGSYSHLDGSANKLPKSNRPEQPRVSNPSGQGDAPTKPPKSSRLSTFGIGGLRSKKVKTGGDAPYIAPAHSDSRAVASINAMGDELEATVNSLSRTLEER